MFTDGLEDAYEGRLMGLYADELAQSRQFPRERQDDYALMSLERAQEAVCSGAFDAELSKCDELAEDEQPLRARPEKIRSLKPAFGAGGTVTAANASSISDGAAALLLMPFSEAERRGLEPLAKIVAHAGLARALGHPIRASGARIIVTLLHAMRRRNARKGIAALCIGGGEATAIALEAM